MVVRIGFEGIGTITPQPVVSRQPSIIQPSTPTGQRTLRGKVTVITAISPEGLKEEVVAVREPVKEVVAKVERGEIIRTPAGRLAEVPPEEQRRIRTQQETLVRQRIAGQFEAARRRVAERKVTEVRAAQPRFLLAPAPGIRREVTGKQLFRLSLIPGVGTFVQQEAVRQLLIKGLERGQEKLAERETKLAGFGIGALSLIKFSVKHPLITTGIIIAPQIAGAVAVKAGISAGVVAGVSKGVLIGAGAITGVVGVKEFKVAPTEIEKGKALFKITAGITMITAGTVSLGRQVVRPRITRIDTKAIARETLRVDKKTRFDVAARARVGVRKLLGRERFKQVEVAGQVVTEPSPLRPGFFEARARFAARLKGRKDIISIGKVRELIKTEGKITKGVSATQIKPPTPKGRIQRFISAKIGFKAAETPRGELQLTTGRTIELLKKGLGKPFTERGITIIKRIPEERPQEFGFGMFVRPRVKPSVPSPTLGGVEQVVRETAIRAITPTPKPVPSVPIIREPTKVVREVPPSEFEGLGLFERTEEVAVVTPKGLGLQLEAVKIRERFLIQPKTIETIKTREAVATITAVAVRTIQLAKPATITKPITTQAQAQAQAIAGAVPSPPTLIGEVPIRPPPAFAFGFRPGGFKRVGRRELRFGISKPVQYTPSLVAQEFGVTATREEIKQIIPIGVFGVRPLPKSARVKRKTALFQEIGI